MNEYSLNKTRQNQVFKAVSNLMQHVQGYRSLDWYMDGQRSIHVSYYDGFFKKNISYTDSQSIIVLWSLCSYIVCTIVTT